MAFEKVKQSLKDADAKEVGKALGLGAALCAKWIKQTVESAPIKEGTQVINQVVDKVKEGFVSGWNSEEGSSDQKAQTSTSQSTDKGESVKKSAQSQEQSVPGGDVESAQKEVTIDNFGVQESGIHRPKVARKSPAVKSVRGVLKDQDSSSVKKSVQANTIKETKIGAKRVIKKVQTDDSKKAEVKSTVKRSSTKM